MPARSLAGSLAAVGRVGRVGLQWLERWPSLLLLLPLLLLLSVACTPGSDDSALPAGTVRVGYIAPAAAPPGMARMARSATFGARLGAEEAVHAARLVGGTFDVRAREARSAAEAVAAADSLIGEGVIAIVGGYDDATCEALAARAERARVVFVNVGCRADSLRRAGRTYTFHVEASDSMYHAAAMEERAADASRAVLWHAGLTRYGAGQLNDRFVRRFGEGATAEGWAGWMAMKAIWEAARDLEQPSGPALARRLTSGDAAFDGHKGTSLAFAADSRQLRQPLYVAASGGGAPAREETGTLVRPVADESAAVRAALSRGARLALVTNEGSQDLTVLDRDAATVIASIPLGERPRGVQVSPDGRRAFVALSDDAPTTESDRDAIAEVDLRQGRVIARHPAGTDPEQFGVTPDGRRLYAANEDAGTATVSELASGRVLATLVVGIEPEGVAVSPDGRWVYVTAETSNTVSVIDTRSDQVVANFAVDVRPRAAAFSPDGARAYVTNEISGTLSIVDVGRHAVIGAVPLDSGRAKPVGVVTSPDGRWVYVANGRANTVSVVDAAAQREVAVIPVGSRPWGIAVSPDGERLFTANGISNDVSVVDARTRAVIGTIAVGERPWGVVVVP